MKISLIETFGFKNAMIGMRYPKNSEHLNDSSSEHIGPRDLSLLLKLTKAGRDHRKALRMIHVQASIDMPISWWIQYDTYKVATVANSRSRMHKMGSRFLTEEDFFIDSDQWTPMMLSVLSELNELIDCYQFLGKEGNQEVRRKLIWKQIIDLLPMSYQQERMIDINYETLVTILNSRYNEKLSTEWRYFCDTFLEQCPYLTEIWLASKGQMESE